jgi:hypothetical protein
MSDELSQPTDADMDKFVSIVSSKAKEVEPGCLENVNPAKAAKALWMRAQGVSRRQVRDKCGVGLATLRRLEDMNEEALDPIRKKYAKSWLYLEDEAHQALFKKFERYEDNPELLDEVSPDRLALMAGIAQDKAMTLAGEANTIVEHRSGKSMEDALESIKMAKARVAEKKVIDVESEEA